VSSQAGTCTIRQSSIYRPLYQQFAILTDDKKGNRATPRNPNRLIFPAQLPEKLPVAIADLPVCERYVFTRHRSEEDKSFSDGKLSVGVLRVAVLSAFPARSRNLLHGAVG